MQPIVEAGLKFTQSLVNTPGITSLLHGFYAVPGLTLLADIGIVEQLTAGKPVQLDSYCKENDLDFEFVKTWCDYFTLYEYLKEEGGSYSTTQQGLMVMMRWPQVMLNYAYHPLLAELGALARKQKTYGYGKDVYRSMYFDAKGAGGLGARMSFPDISDYLSQKKHSCILDLGCGDGTFLATACKQNPGLKAVGIDQSQIAVDEARANFERHGLGGRGTFLQGDIMAPKEVFSDPACRDVEVATIMQILQEITDNGVEPVLHFLNEFKTHLPGTALAVTEFYRLDIDDMKAYLTLGVAESAIHHDLSDQNLLRREHWLSLYEQAGFRLVDSIVHVQAPSRPPVIETLVIKPV